MKDLAGLLNQSSLNTLTIQLNPLKEHPERIRKVDKKHFEHITNPKEIIQEDKELISNLGYDGIEFPVQGKDFSKIEVKNNDFVAFN